MMNPAGDLSNPAAHETPASSPTEKAASGEALSSESALSNQRLSEERHFGYPNLPPTFDTAAEAPGIAIAGDEHYDNVITSDGPKQQAVCEGVNAVNVEAQTYSECLEDLSQLEKLDLRPCSFTSLADAFHASLCVIRCLRGIIRLQGGFADSGLTGQQPGNNRSPQGLRVVTSSVAAEALSHQEAFAADETAYTHLLKQPSSSPQDPACVRAQPVSDDASTTCKKAPSSPVLQGVSACSTPAQPTGAPPGCSGLNQGRVSKSLSESPVIAGVFPSTSVQTQGRLEYELSVCKALLLLQHLTPNCTTTVEDSPVHTSPHTTPSHNIAGRATSQTAGSTTKRTCEFTKVSDSGCRGFQATILDILLRVRLLQGTQQLVRADFARLLHQQQKQQQELLKAVQTTVMKLEAERDTLLGRMQKLSAFVSRK
ncbi:hypothetical protein, conserved [Eimeria brunetti]|uniref:Uncharacterized protein n=1 Tax=Eimeria brunetti TaxID=51314 RepID=U6LGE4_9EIME|nr:hypothetical protein, conserved [Eimeria brunetti]